MRSSGSGQRHGRAGGPEPDPGVRDPAGRAVPGRCLPSVGYTHIHHHGCIAFEWDMVMVNEPVVHPWMVVLAKPRQWRACTSECL
ncbi:uncharacterized protein LOC114675015 isoform X6 [Macaca mulatta]